MAHFWIFGVLWLAAGFLERCDHLSRTCRFHGLVFATVKYPNRHAGNPFGLFLVTTATNRDCCSKQARKAGYGVPGSVAAHREARYIESVCVNAELFL